MPRVDTVILREVQLYAYHGARPEEQALGQRFVLDVEVDADLRPAGERDALDETVNYAALYRQVRAAFEAAPCALIEAAAERVAQAVLAGQPRALAVRVEVRKPAAPIAGAVLAHAAVRIERRREPGT